MNDLISIIIPVYNSQKYLKECVESIMNQTYKNIEILLIDDGSTDKSGLICDKLANRDNRIKVLHKQNTGVSDSRNVGLKISTGAFITFVDSDDYIEKDMYDFMLRHIKENNADIGICNWFKKEKDNEHKNVVSSEIQKKLDIKLFLKWMKKPDGYGGYVCNKIYKREVIFKDNGNFIKFDDKIFILEDLLFNCEISNRINKVLYFDKCFYHYRQHKNSSLHQFNAIKRVSSLSALTKIVVFFEENDIKMANEIKLEFIKSLQLFKYDILYSNKEISIEDTEILNSCIIENDKTLKKYLRQNVFFKCGNLKLKLSCLMLIISPKIYNNIKSFFIKKV